MGLFEDFLERVEAIAPGTASFNSGGGTATMDFVVKRNKLAFFIQDILGNSSFNGNGGLTRNIPLAHPEYNWLYASSIQTVQGLGPYGIEDAGKGEVALLDNISRNMPKYYVMYDTYRVSVQFDARPYLVLTDTQLDGFRKQRKDWVGYDFANPVAWNDQFEWGRFVSIRKKPKSEMLPSNYGTFSMLSPDFGPLGAALVNQATGAGPRIVYSTNEVEIKWYMVPYEIIKNANWGKAYGTIHNNGEDKTDPFYGHEDGSLLLLGIEIEDYSGARPKEGFNLNPAQPESLMTALFGNRFCDVTFKMVEFKIPPTLNATDPAGGAFPPPGLVMANHNRVPSAKLMKWCYATAEPIGGLRPMFTSTDYRRLFRMDT
jgi:hypothetical protein